MASLKLTKAVVDRLPAPDPSGKQKLWWDSELTGLGIRCSGSTSSKAWIVQHARSRRYTIGATILFDRDQAWEKAAPILRDLVVGIDPKTEEKKAQRANITVQEVLDLYLEQPRLAPRSRITYAKLAERHLQSWLSRALRSITAEDCEARFRAVTQDVIATREAGGSKGGVNVTGKAASNQALTLFRSLWNFWSERDESLPREAPTRLLKKQWHELEPRDRRLWPEDMPRFHAGVLALQNTIARDLILFGLYTGTRENEAAGLKWSEVDFPHKTIRLPAGRMKGGKTFVLPMSRQVYDLLVEVRARGVDGPFCFPGNGQSGHTESFGYALAQVSQATGLKISCHDLRRTFISIAETCPIPPYASRLLTAHAIAKGDIHGGYVRLSDDDLRKAAQVVADRISELCGIEKVEAANLVRVG